MKSLTVLLCLLASQLMAQEFQISPAEAWVVPHQIKSKDWQYKNEEYSSSMLLFDRQIHHDDELKATYYRSIHRVNNENALKEMGKMELVFEPGYEQLVVHDLIIHRNGQAINVLANQSFELIRQEKELDKQMYTGTKSALLVIEDLQVGDYLELAFTRKGDNPIFDGRMFAQFQMEWSMPIKYLNLSVKVKQDQPLYLKNQKNDYPPTKISNNGQYKRYQWSLEDVSGVDFEGQVPADFLPFGLLEISEFEHWSEVALWAHQVFSVERQIHDELKDKLKVWKQLPSQAAQVSAALQYVQNKIRYFGIELGVNSHQPRTPKETVETKYGDCKDKTVLLQTLLNEMGIDALPALVSTESKSGIKDFQPSPGVFNHVILKVSLNGKNHWLDPTITHQGASIDHIGEVQYGAALIVKKEGGAIEPMTLLHPEYEGKRVTETFLVDENNKTSLTSKSTMQGFHAESMRSVLKEQTQNDLNNHFVSYFSQLYGPVTMKQPVLYDDVLEQNRLKQSDFYDIEGMWKDSGQYLYSDLVIWGLVDALELPSRMNRRMPLAQSFPLNLAHEVKVQGEGVKPKTEVKDLDIQSPYVRFSRKVKQSEGDLRVVFELKTLKDSVAVEDMKTYLKDLKTINDALYMRVFMSHNYEEKMSEKEDELKRMLQDMLKKRGQQ